MLCAHGNGSWWCQVRMQRWYSGRGSSFTSQESCAERTHRDNLTYNSKTTPHIAEVLTFNERSTPTLAFMMVGRGSKIPCIFLRAGMTKRLHVTTADTGLPERERRWWKASWEGSDPPLKHRTQTESESGSHSLDVGKR